MTITETTRTANANGTAATPGPGLGFQTLDQERELTSLGVEGTIPGWLEGALHRTGPARFEVGEQQMKHWFDGYAMLHRFAIAGGEVAYANRYLETRAYRAAEERGEITYSEFGTDPCRSVFSRIFSVFSPKISDNANVNMVALGERFVAMTETPLPVEFDPETLAAGGTAYEAPGMLTTAHPHLDRANGGMLNYAAKLGPRNHYRFFSLAPDALKPEVVAELPVGKPAYMHSFGLTERWFVLAEFPFVVNPMQIPLSGRPYIENYRWEPGRGTRFTLIDRTTGEAKGPFKTDACFAFHHVNAYEDGDEVVVDASVYPDAKIVEDLYLDRLRAGHPVADAKLRRFRISPGSGEVSGTDLSDASFELPRINYGRCNERPYRYAWGIGAGEGSRWVDRIVRIDVESGETSAWSEDGCYPGEPVFVAAPDAAAEDDGVLLSVVLDARSERSFLLVLDAAELTELARAEAPHHIPFGFHGAFTSA